VAANIGEVFVNGQNQDVWCDSKMVITDLTMYDVGKFNTAVDTPSCYPLYGGKLYTYTGLECAAKQDAPASGVFFICA